MATISASWVLGHLHNNRSNTLRPISRDRADLFVIEDAYWRIAKRRRMDNGTAVHDSTNLKSGYSYCCDDVLCLTIGLTVISKAYKIHIVHLLTTLSNNVLDDITQTIGILRRNNAALTLHHPLLPSFPAGTFARLPPQVHLPLHPLVQTRYGPSRRPKRISHLRNRRRWRRTSFRTSSAVGSRRYLPYIHGLPTLAYMVLRLPESALELPCPPHCKT